MWRVIVGLIGCLGGAFIVVKYDRGTSRLWFFVGGAVFAVGSFVWLTGHHACDDEAERSQKRIPSHRINVTPKLLPATSTLISACRCRLAPVKGM